MISLICLEEQYPQRIFRSSAIPINCDTRNMPNDTTKPQIDQGECDNS